MSAWLAAGVWSAGLAQGPLATKINVTPVAVYTGSSALPKPEKIVVYDFAVNPDDVQVDKILALRPRHLRLQDGGCDGKGDIKVDGRTGLDQDQRQRRDS
jgi:hypothetical protein